MSNKPLESRIYSFVKQIWGIFIFIQMCTQVIREWTYGAEQAFENQRK